MKNQTNQKLKKEIRYKSQMRWQWWIKKWNDDDDQVNKYADQVRSEEESEEKDQTEISKKYALESDILEPDEKYQKDKEVLFKRTKTPTKGYEDDLVHTDNDQDTNNEESEEIDQRWERKKDNLELDYSETDERDQIKIEELFMRN